MAGYAAATLHPSYYWNDTVTREAIAVMPTLTLEDVTVGPVVRAIKHRILPTVVLNLSTVLGPYERALADDRARKERIRAEMADDEASKDRAFELVDVYDSAVGGDVPQPTITFNGARAVGVTFALDDFAALVAYLKENA